MINLHGTLGNSHVDFLENCFLVLPPAITLSPVPDENDVATCSGTDFLVNQVAFLEEIVLRENSNDNFT
jgi:hypothetical protein